MPDDDDAKVGYKSPPKEHQFKKGQTGNPKGRPRKPRSSEGGINLASILEGTANEKIFINGREMSFLEVEIQALQRKAAKGDVAASKHLAKLRSDAGVGIATLNGGGVLVVPGVVPIDEWTLAAARQQAKYREVDYGKID